MKQMQASRADTTTLAVDAIFNAANSSLLSASGGIGSIHRAAGPELLDACRKLAGCLAGQAGMTAGFRLPAAHIIHTKGPVWQGRTKGEEARLRSCNATCLALENCHGLQSSTFASISIGAYRYPIQAPARIAVESVRAWVREHEAPSEITSCCFSGADLGVYRKVLGAAAAFEA